MLHIERSMHHDDGSIHHGDGTMRHFEDRMHHGEGNMHHGDGSMHHGERNMHHNESLVAVGDMSNYPEDPGGRIVRKLRERKQRRMGDSAVVRRAAKLNELSA